MYINRKADMVKLSVKDNIWAMFSNNIQTIGQPFHIILDRTLAYFFVDNCGIFSNPFLEFLNCLWGICIDTTL